uniref:TNFAIP3 interacting protein 1 n=1 Tax=Sus scrofa TaxID=9823 RepID=A0A8D0PTD9_PIG
MEGRGPYRIYDPGGGVPLEEASAAFERLVEENSRLKEKMQGIRMLGELLEESQMEASRLRQKAEELVRDNEPLPSPSPSLASFDHLAELTGKEADVPAPAADPAHPSGKPEPVPKPPSSGTSSEFEVVPTEGHSPPESGGHTRNAMELGPLPHEDGNLMLHLQRLETTLSVCAEESDHSQLFMHLGRMALEFNRLASKVHKNEQRTSILQTLCEQLRKENEALKAKLDKGLEQRDQAAERLREENLELRKLLMNSGQEGASGRPGSPKMEGAGKKGLAAQQQAGMSEGKIPEVGALGAAEKKVRMLEQQRTELLEVNKQWDQHFRSMKQQYEQKITELRQKLADAQKQVTDLEAEREQKQRDFDRKLLLAKSKIEMEETDKEQLTAEAKELRQKVKYLQDQLSPLTRQREYQEKEIQRLNKVGRASLSPCSAHPVAWVRARALRAMVQPHGLRPPPFPPHALGASPGRALLCRPWDVLFAHTMLPEHHAGGASTLPPQQGLLPSTPPHPSLLWVTLFYVPKAPAASFTPLLAFSHGYLLMTRLPIQWWEACVLTRVHAPSTMPGAWQQARAREVDVHRPEVPALEKRGSGEMAPGVGREPG